MNYVIIGNSAAAVGGVEGIRLYDKTGKITIISDEKYHTYSRPLISYYLEGRVDTEKMKYRPSDFYEKNNVEVMLGKKAIRIDTDNKCVELEDSGSVPYDKLLIATGSSPFVPPIAGIDKVEHYTFMSMDDCENLKKSLKPGAKIAVLGGGLIGLKACEGLHKTSSDITVIDLADRILSSILDPDGAELVQKRLENQGVKFRLGVSAASVSESEITLSDGSKLPFDTLVCAVGVRPNTQLAKGCGIAVNRGIVTDQNQKTSTDDIYAAGDCTESFDISSNQQKILAILPNAYLQGSAAGKSMTGNPDSFDKAIPMNAIGFFGYHVLCAGNVSSGDTNVVYKTDNAYRRLALKDSVLMGYIMVGEVKNAGIYTNLIREKVKLSEEQQELVKNGPSMFIYGREYRNEKLAGIKSDAE